MRPPKIAQPRGLPFREDLRDAMRAQRNRYEHDVIECPRCHRMTRVPGGWTGPCMDCETLKGALL